MADFLKRCERCGKRWYAGASNARWCPKCQPVVVREQKRDRYAATFEDRECLLCHTTFKGFKRAKYCPRCRPAATRENAAAGSRRWTREHRRYTLMWAGPEMGWWLLVRRIEMVCKEEGDTCQMCMIYGFCTRARD
jgi:hypothetical protein